MATDGNPREVNLFVDWAYGKEADATHGAASRFVRAHVHLRPAAMDAAAEARWADFDAMRVHAGNSGPTVTTAQLNAAIAAYRAG